MKSLDEILRDPKAHGTPPSELEVQAWNEEVLARWAAERPAVPAGRASQRPVASVLFWGSVGLGLLYFSSLVWDNRGASLSRLRDFTRDAPATLLDGLGMHPQWWSLAAILLAVTLTRPLREFLMRQLD